MIIRKTENENSIWWLFGPVMSDKMKTEMKTRVFIFIFILRKERPDTTPPVPVKVKVAQAVAPKGDVRAILCPRVLFL